MNLTRREWLGAGASGLTAWAAGLPHLCAEETEHQPIKPLLTGDVIADRSRAAQPSLQFLGSSPVEYHDWQKRFRRQLDLLLGDYAPPEHWEVIEEQRWELEDHTRLALILRAKGVADLPLYLLIPKEVTTAQPRPAVLCVHGHGPFGHDAVAGRHDLPGVSDNIRQLNYDYGLQFVRRGYVVAAPCMIPFGRRVDRKKYGGNDPCAVTFVRMQALGLLPISANLRDLRWSLSLLASLPEVEKSRLGCAGLSYGGRMAMMVSAVDDRIKVAAVSGALNLLQERMTHRHSCGSQIIPGLLKHGDYSEIGSLIAPRPCVWEVGSTDPLIGKKWANLFKRRLQRAYAALGVADRLRFDHFEGGHRWNGQVAFPMFDTVLKA